MNRHEHGHRHHDEAMLSVEDALERILDHFHVLDIEEAPLLDALGQVLAEDAVSAHDIPPLDNSAMDGYAVQAASVANAKDEAPVTLRVVGTIAAGELPKTGVEPGTAVRIMTGAPIPPGADVVVPFEETDETERRNSGLDITEIGIKTAAPVGSDIRPAGQDVRKNTRVLSAGAILRPSEIGVLASLGFGKVKVVRRPVVAILSTGDELLDAGDSYAEGKIYDANSYSVAASVLRYGGLPKLLGIARDNLDSMNAKLREGLEADMLITSAGVSKGDYDMVKDVLADHGRVAFWSVRMRPAKPLAFGVLNAWGDRQVPHLGLPGNPVSAMVAFEQFGRAAIHKMMGKTGYLKPRVQAILDEPIYNTDGRRVYARAVISKQNGDYHAKLTGNQSSNLLTSMAGANGLAVCPEDLPVKEAGETVEVQMLDWPEDVF
ncbi:MAG: molybdopterin molybdotransferase MoeA [Dehalococcoidia bacterium]|nr:molybdopterin molybdotransferase MoeA [Dehalococcoidia bacterium]